MDYDRLRELQQKYDENPRRYFAPLANEYRKGGQLKRAIEICRAQLAEMPGHMSGQIVFGQALYESGEFEEARKVFERAIALDPENLIALRSLGDMSLQAGDTAEARTWYARLLEADPKDTAVIALVTEIDASSDGAPVPMSQEIPGVDSDAGDQEIPVLEPEVAQPPVAAQQPASPSPEPRETEAIPVPSASHDSPPMNSEVAAAESARAPEGLERHYPTEEASAPHEDVEPLPPPALTREELGVPIGNSAAEGLRSMKEDVNAFSWSPPPEPPPAEPPLVSRRPPPPPREVRPVPPQPPPREVRPAPLQVAPAQAAAPEPVVVPEPVAPEPVVAPELAAAAEAVTNAFAAPSQPAPVEKSVAEPPSIAEKQTTAASGEKTFTGAAGEPFVNETMAQLYLQQGYKQLALRIYRQLAESRPQDAALLNRIAEIEAEDAAAHPDEVAARKVAASEKPTERPFPRSPSIESPTPIPSPDSQETPGFGEAPVDSPPAREPSRHWEPVERPIREEPRPEPEAMSARQPSIREFFATLGRRKPPRAPASGGPSHGGGNNQPAESQIPLGAAPPSATLDTVFAGATVSPSDARAASRLAGAFSGASGASRTPPTPPMPTPRLNPRVPQAQESEEDVAKFRAWLDGLTGE